MNTLFILGAGAFGREVASVAQMMNHWGKIYFVDENKSLINSKVNDILVIGDIDDLVKSSGDVFVAIANQKNRMAVVEKLTLNSNLCFPNIIHPNNGWLNSKLNKIGIGNYLAEGVIGTVNIDIGNFNIINLGCLLSHDTTIKLFCNLMHGVKITSGAFISDFVNIGAGACIVSKLIIGPARIINPNQVVEGDG